MSDSILDMVTPPPSRDACIYGVVAGIVTSTDDPEKLGRVKVRFLWLADTDESDWIRVAVPLAGEGSGLWMIPHVDDEVLVAFEQGHTAIPYVIGSLWSKREKNGPPAAGAEAGSGVQMLRSRSGHVVRLDDRKGQEKIEIVDRSGKSSIVLDTRENAITLTCQGDLMLESKGGHVVVKAAKGVEITSRSGVQVQADADVNVRARANVKVKGTTIDLN